MVVVILQTVDVVKEPARVVSSSFYRVVISGRERVSEKTLDFTTV